MFTFVYIRRLSHADVWTFITFAQHHRSMLHMHKCHFDSKFWSYYSDWPLQAYVYEFQVSLQAIDLQSLAILCRHSFWPWMCEITNRLVVLCFVPFLSFCRKYEPMPSLFFDELFWSSLVQMRCGLRGAYCPIYLVQGTFQCFAHFNLEMSFEIRARTQLGNHRKMKRSTLLKHWLLENCCRLEE